MQPLIGFERFCVMERIQKEEDYKGLLIFCTSSCNFVNSHPIHVSKNNSMSLLKLQYLHLCLE